MNAEQQNKLLEAFKINDRIDLYKEKYGEDWRKVFDEDNNSQYNHTLTNHEI